MVNWPEQARKLRDYDRVAAELEQLRLQHARLLQQAADETERVRKQRDHAYAVERDQSAELAKLRTEGVPGVVHEVDKAFHALAIKERDYARVQTGNRDLELGEMRSQIGELKAEVGRLKAELDTAQRRKVLLCPSVHIPEAMSTSMGEEDGTLIRASDDPTLEWVLKEGAWTPT
jgi:chromosome segregation ATPase